MIDLSNIGLSGYYLDEETTDIYGKTGRKLSQRIDKFGYKVISVEVPGVSKNQRVHKIVAKTCVPNPDPITNDNVMHMDDNKLNCMPSNLCWGTSKQNNHRHNPQCVEYTPQHGKGKNNHAVRKDKARIMQGLQNGMSVTECTRVFGVGWNTVKRYQQELAMKCND